MWQTAKYSIWWFSCWLAGALNPGLQYWTAFSNLPSLSHFFFVKALFCFVFCLRSVPTTAHLFILDLIGYNNLIRHSNSKNVDILYKLLALLENREQIISNRNTKTNYQITNSANQPLTVMWLVMHLPVNPTSFGNCLGGWGGWHLRGVVALATPPSLCTALPSTWRIYNWIHYSCK